MRVSWTSLVTVGPVFGGLGEYEYNKQCHDSNNKMQLTVLLSVTKGVTIAAGACFLNTIGRICISLYWVQIPLLAKQDAGSNPYQ